MGDPRHPTKVIVVVEKGMVTKILQDKDTDIRFFIADYDTLNDASGFDKYGRPRSFEEEPSFIDTMEIRAIVNKKGGG